MATNTRGMQYKRSKHCPWSFVPTASVHQGFWCAYEIKHKETGVFCLGFTKNLYIVLSTYASKLRSGIHENIELQLLFDISPHFEVIYHETGPLTEPTSRFNAAELHSKWQWDSRYHPMLMRMHHTPRRIGQPVRINGVGYATQQDAAKAFGMTRETLMGRVQSPYYPEWQHAVDVRKAQQAAQS